MIVQYISFVDIENTLPAIMVERVSCIYWDYPSISMLRGEAYEENDMPQSILPSTDIIMWQIIYGFFIYILLDYQFFLSLVQSCCCFRSSTIFTNHSTIFGSVCEKKLLCFLSIVAITAISSSLKEKSNT